MPDVLFLIPWVVARILAQMMARSMLRIGKTVHSKEQLEHFGMLVEDTSRDCGGKQCVITPDGHTIPVQLGRVFVPLRFTNHV